MVDNIFKILREMEETDPVDSKEVFQHIKENGLLMHTETFKKKCVGIIDAQSLKEQDYDLWLRIGEIDGVGGNEEEIESYISNNSGVLIIQMVSGEFDIYSPSQENIDNYTNTCQSDEQLSDALKDIEGVEFKSKSDEVVSMVDLEELKTMGFRIKKNGLKTSWGVQSPEENGHRYGSFVALETDKEDTYLVAKDDRGLPANYRPI